MSILGIPKGINLNLRDNSLPCSLNISRSTVLSRSCNMYDIKHRQLNQVHLFPSNNTSYLHSSLLNIKRTRNLLSHQFRSNSQIDQLKNYNLLSLLHILDDIKLHMDLIILHSNKQRLPCILSQGQNNFHVKLCFNTHWKIICSLKMSLCLCNLQVHCFICQVLCKIVPRNYFLVNPLGIQLDTCSFHTIQGNIHQNKMCSQFLNMWSR